MNVFDLHSRAYKLNKGRSLYQKIILIITMRGRLQGKNKRNQEKKQKKTKQKIAVKCYCLPPSFYPLEVAFLKLAK